MKRPVQPNTTEHPNDLLLPYLEGLLSPPEQERVQEHLRWCAQCASAAEDLRKTIALLAQNKEAFCPDEWELYEYAHYGNDPDGLVSRHLRHCASCRETTHALTERATPDHMPERLLTDIVHQYQPASRTSPAEHAESESLIARVRRMFRFPAIAVGVATAAVIGFMLLRTPELPQSVIALSSVSWDKAPKPKSLHSSRKNAAVVLTLKNVDPPWPGSKIDALYEALIPSVEVQDRYHMVPPRVIRDSLDRSALRLRDSRAVITMLSQRLALDAVVEVTIAGVDQGARVQVDLIDVASHQVTAHETEAQVPWKKLEETVRQLMLGVLLSTEKGTHAPTK